GARGSDVLHQIRLVDRLPQVARLGPGLVVGQVRVVVEVGRGVGEGRVPQLQEPFDVPPLDVGGMGVDVDREVEQVRHGESRSRLQDVESLQDQDVGSAYDLLLTGQDVVG